MVVLEINTYVKIKTNRNELIPANSLNENLTLNDNFNKK